MEQAVSHIGMLTFFKQMNSVAAEKGIDDAAGPKSLSGNISRSCKAF